jgi:pimeloyl-ACP methyl ester carboxylesterase
MYPENHSTARFRLDCLYSDRSMAADLVKSMVPSARVELFDDTGHPLFVDDSDRFNSVLDDFLQHVSLQ